MMLGAQLASFLSIELQMKRTIFASAAFIAVNILLNFVFLGVLKMNAFGLALASSIGCWIYFFIQGQYYLTGKSLLKFRRGVDRFHPNFELIKYRAKDRLGS